MAPGLDGEVERVLQSLGRLYGAGNPAASQAAVLARTIAEDMHSALNGGLSSGYSDARQSHTAVLDRHHERDGVTHGAVAKTGDGTVLGRNVINDQLAEYRSRLQALATVATSRFSGPAMLTSAHTIINNVVRQVNADSESTRRHAAQITMTAGAVRRRGSAGRVRGRLT
ncbi:MAG: peptidase P60, partial [Mycobacteriaceae bacterium]|nr:peptidase P60 [Mycobacteriaceae bacterium]